MRIQDTNKFNILYLARKTRWIKSKKLKTKPHTIAQHDFSLTSHQFANYKHSELWAFLITGFSRISFFKRHLYSHKHSKYNNFDLNLIVDTADINVHSFMFPVLM